MPKPEGIAKDQDGNVIQALELGHVFKIDYLATSVQSTVIGATVVRLIATTDCYVEVGANPTATASTSTLVSAMVPEYIKIGDEDKLAAIRLTTDGTLNITVVEHPLGPPALDLDFTKEEFDARITFTRASSATFFDGNGILKTAVSGAPRTKAYVFDGTNWINRGFLIEEARTNLILQSEDFATTWNIARGSISTDQIVAPDGTTTADKHLGSTDNDTHPVFQSISFTSGTAYTFVIFAKKAEHTRMSLLFAADPFPGTPFVVFNLDTGVIDQVDSNVDSSSIQNVGNGWFRCSMTATADASVTGNIIHYLDAGSSGNEQRGFAGSTTEGSYIWGAQIEAGAFPTSYIATTTAAVTRAADVATMSDVSWWNDLTGTLFVEAIFIETATTAFQVLVHISDGANNNFARLNSRGGSEISGQMNNLTGNGLFIEASGVTSSGVTFKAILAYAENDGAMSIDGAAVGTDTNVGLPPAWTVTTLAIGVNPLSDEWCNGYIARITYWNRRLSNKFLQDITS